ncbi:MAG: metal-dependent hydrolase [Archangiaceae bacterium]|nr:metal-dependent hydrolase [Archangiaceae bacterium]
MASLGHVAVGIAMGRAFTPAGAPRARLVKACVAFSALAMLPDADVIGFPLGVQYGDPWGHRGATHSFVFALLVTLAAYLAAPPLKLPPLATAVCTLVSIGTHGLLDSLTNGGLGCALLWPFSNERFFAPFTPIPVAPIGGGMLSLRGLLVLLVELVLFSPLLIYATFPRRR